MFIEVLERRRLYAVTVQQTSPGNYEIQGDGSANTIDVAIDQGDAAFTMDGVTYANVQSLAIYTGDGDTTVSVSSDTDGPVSTMIHLGNGNDTVNLNGSGAIWGGGGFDTIVMSNAFYGAVYGGTGNTSITLTGDDICTEVWGGAGTNIIDASASNYGVVIHAGSANDLIKGSAYEDVIYGTGADTIIAGGGDDMIYMDSGTSRSLIDGGSGYTTCIANNMQGTIQNCQQVYSLS